MKLSEAGLRRRGPAVACSAIAAEDLSDPLRPPRPSPEAYRRLTDLAGRLGAATVEQLSAILRTELTGTRTMVGALASRGRLRIVQTTSTIPALRPADDGRHPEAVVITDEAWAWVQALAHRRHGRVLERPRPPREDTIVHHLLVVAAAIDLLQDRGARLIALASDEQLRSEARRGRRLRKGDRDPRLPDGRLIYRTATSEETSVDIEIIVSKYTDADIIAKHRALPPSTLFFVPTEKLQARVERLGCPAPRLLR